MRHRARASPRRLGAADVEPAVHLRRIDANDLDREFAREPQREVLLPVPVGPVSTAIGGFVRSAPAQEHAIELVQGDLRPGRTTVIALIRARRVLHLPQQRVHLRQREPAMRVDGRAAGDRA